MKHSNAFNKLYFTSKRLSPVNTGCNTRSKLTAWWFNYVFFVWHIAKMGRDYKGCERYDKDKEFIFSNLVLLTDDEWEKIQYDMLELINEGVFDGELAKGWIRDLDTVRAFG